MDPETGLNEVRNVALKADKIVQISTRPLRGNRTIDASGLVVAPGFIDLHNHSPTPLGHRYQALDGVTTSLELEAGAHPVTHFATPLANGSALNFGASTGHAMARVQMIHKVNYPHMIDAGPDAGKINFNSAAFKDQIDPAQIDILRSELNRGLDLGGLGIGLLLDYMSEAINDRELRMIFEVAGARNAPVFVHVRRGLAGDISGLMEVIDLATQTGAPLHICHLQHSAMKGTTEFLKQIRLARAAGVDITTEFFPYNAGSTTISSAVFFRDWQAIFDISYEDVEWAETGERLTRETWHEYQTNQPKGSVIHHYVHEEWTREVVEAQDAIVVTDGLPAFSEETGIPPQGVGSYSRMLGHYVRNEQALSLMSALRKMTLLPAQRMENIAPVFKRKGRVQIGADADITIFDPDKIMGNATYRNPYQASTGVQFLIVNGQLVVENGAFLGNSLPGKRLTSLLQ